MDPDDLLTGPAVDAAVSALAERNHHHLAQMAPDEKEDALGHWRELAITVLSNAAPTGVPEGLTESFFDLVLDGKLQLNWVEFANRMFDE